MFVILERVESSGARSEENVKSHELGACGPMLSILCGD